MKHKAIMVRHKTGRVFRQFPTVLDLGIWLFDRSNWKSQAETRNAIRHLRLSRSLVDRASNAYVAWVLGRSRIRPAR